MSDGWLNRRHKRDAIISLRRRGPGWTRPLRKGRIKRPDWMKGER